MITLNLITICCSERRSIFGVIKNNQVYLNKYGLIAHHTWLETIDKRDGIELGEFIVMPNHIHGILIFSEEFYEQGIQFRKRGVCHTPLRSPSRNLGAIIRGYKSSVTSQLRSELGDNIWQRNYYEHIIRNEQSYEQLSNYIVNNPFTWEQDYFFE
ncbi:transposase [Caviibacterium pharyngocola]|uniref:transposase n=1 Tax=Caviibacterium pharyngocola TaxID=28159 RepID=UPI001FAF3385|nr:transposase [Caviibacterium pharyngocola]